MKIFSKQRIKFTELYNDAMNFLIKEYNQAKQLFTAASPFGQLLQVIIELGRLILFYIEDSITELNIFTARRNNSIYGLARLTGHNPRRGFAARGVVKLIYNNTKNSEVFNNTIIIPNFTKIINNDTNVSYLIKLDKDFVYFNLKPTNYLTATIIQGEIEIQTATGTGEKLQSYSFAPKKGLYIDDDISNIKVYVNSEPWKIYDSLLDIGYNEKGCVIKTGINGGIDLYFGDEYKGAIPSLGAEIRIEYIVHNGIIGNYTNLQTLFFKFEDYGFDLLGNDIDLNNFLIIKPESQILFGSEPESIELTKLIAPYTSRNFILANENNYLYFFKKMNYFSKIKVFKDNDNIGLINVLLIPDIKKRLNNNENYFTIDINKFILSENEIEMIYEIIDKSNQKLINTDIKIINPKLKKYVINIYLSIFDGYDKSIIKENILVKLNEYLLNNLRFNKIPKSDIIAIIEKIDGVDSVNISFISEENENNKRINSESKIVGFNSLGDIFLENDDEYPIIRGGFYDRKGNYYYDIISDDKLGIVNIYFINK